MSDTQATLQRYGINYNKHLELRRKAPSLQTSLLAKATKTPFCITPQNSCRSKFEEKRRPTKSCTTELIFGADQTVCLHFVPRRAGSHLQPIRVYETGGAVRKSGEFEMKSSEFNSK